ncbi:Cell division control protein 48 -like protein C [Capsicum baccatum]|uniref:Cell division control protein 48-like protein C n=1 Tax=Capsicum baccatum TaxID=33114 RepID=A0A2G2XS85_CAPBA|nr:Cell division control protein 48 -like protein C [Capsicum baccatum]
MITIRTRDFTWMNSPLFSRYKYEDDPQESLDGLEKITDIMGVTDSESAELAVYRLQRGFGVDLETGFLLYGPPGCGKTLIAKAVANEAGANFIHIKGPEILNCLVGESELSIRKIFYRARTCSPCIVFFDEVDSLTTNRDKDAGSWVIERILNQLLIELDGADQRKAILRPGRLGKLLYLPLPSPDERGLILKALARKKPIDSSVDLVAIGRDDACKKFSGADLAALMNEGAMVALEDKLMAIGTGLGDTPSTFKESHFKQALKKISPSVSDEQIELYESFRAE